MDHFLEKFLVESNEEIFLQEFRQFCDTSLPRNSSFRHELSSLILDSSTPSTSLLPSTWYSKTNLCPPLSGEWENRITEGFQAVTIAHKTGNIPETSLQKLKPEIYLDDCIIVEYIQLLHVQHEVCISDTIMLTNKGMHGVNREIDYDYIRQRGHIFIPIHHLEEEHWTFARLTPCEPGGIRAEHYDSFERLRSVSGLKQLELWSMMRFPGKKMAIIHSQSPQQENSDDCGVFMLMGIRLMSSGSQHLSQNEANEMIPKFRRKVLAELLAGKIDPTPQDCHTFIKLDREEAQRPTTFTKPVEFYGSGGTSDPITFSSPSPQPPSQPLESSLFDMILDTSPQSCVDSPSMFLQPEHIMEDWTDIYPHSLFSLPLDETKGFSMSDQFGDLETKEDVQTQSSTSKAATADDLQDSEMSDFDTESDVHSHGSLKGKKKTPRQVEDFVEDFANQELMLKSLKSAIHLYRSRKQSSTVGFQTLASLWADVGRDDHSIFQRHTRETFSRKFYSEVDRLGGNKNRISRWVQAQLCTSLGSPKAYPNAQSQASRSGIWTELVDCVSIATNVDIISASIACCGCKEPTSTMEQLDFSQRQQFIEGLRVRLLNPLDHLHQTLTAATALYRAVLLKNVPDYRLSIEGDVDLRFMNFTDAVSLAKAPSRVPLPRYAL